MTNKFLIIALLGGSLFQMYDRPNYIDSKAAVVIAGSIIASNHTEDTKKYKRKDCPVCKGKGWYISGDGIERVNCGYCEPDSKEQTLEKVKK
jgi:hypothetical protein